MPDGRIYPLTRTRRPEKGLPDNKIIRYFSKTQKVAWAVQICELYWTLSQQGKITRIPNILQIGTLRRLRWPVYGGRQRTSVQPTSSVHTLSLRGADNPSSRYQSPDFASRHAAEWFPIRTAKPCYQSQLLPLLMMSRVVYAERWGVCDSALLSHTSHADVMEESQVMRYIYGVIRNCAETATRHGTQVQASRSLS